VHVTKERALLGDDGADVDDAAGFLRSHDSHRGLRAKETAREVGRHDPVPVLERGGKNVFRLRSASVVHQNVEATVAGVHRGEEPCDGGFVGHVGGEECARASGDGDDLAGGGAVVVARQIVQRDRGALLGEDEGDAATDASGGTGDKGNFPSERLHTMEEEERRSRAAKTRHARAMARAPTR
jgi:hypothetical protein